MNGFDLKQLPMYCNTCHCSWE